MTLGENHLLENETWSMGSCSKSLDVRYSYPYESTYQRCCLVPKTYILECMSSFDDSVESGMDGWNGGALEILGHKYCDDFVDQSVKRKIIINGTYLGYFIDKRLININEK